MSAEEQNKCIAFSLAVERDMQLFGPDFKRIICKQGSSKDDCMATLDQEHGDVTTLDAGEVFVGGRYHSLIPILQEVSISIRLDVLRQFKNRSKILTTIYFYV